MTDVVYILGPSYSGSTLLTFLLASHPQVGTIGELKATSMGDIDQYDCSCGHQIRRCVFWQHLGELLAHRGTKLCLSDFGTHFRSPQSPLADRMMRARVRGPLLEAVRTVGFGIVPSARRAQKRILEKNQAMIDAVLQLQEADVFVDGSKDPVRLKYMAESGLWNIKVIYILRDGRGQSNSYMKHYRTSMDHAALEWRRTQQACERVISKLPSADCVRLRYEDLCHRPDEQLATLFDFMGVNPEDAPSEYRAAEQHILGNAMRLRSNSEIALDEKWMANLSESDLERFDHIAGAINEQYGYGGHDARLSTPLMASS